MIILICFPQASRLLYILTAKLSSVPPGVALHFALLGMVGGLRESLLFSMMVLRRILLG